MVVARFDKVNVCFLRGQGGMDAIDPGCGE